MELQTLSPENISKINGIGDAISKKILQIISTGSIKNLEELILKTPPGVLEMLKIKGIDQKKFRSSGKKWA